MKDVDIPIMDIPGIDLPSVSMESVTIPGFERHVDPGGNPVAEAPDKLKDLQSEFAKRSKAEASRFADATDSEYWVAFCFRSREHKEQFLRSLKLIELGDKYIDGHQAAENLGVKLDGPKEFRRTKLNKALKSLT
jgi:hypothetical protein